MPRLVIIICHFSDYLKDLKRVSAAFGGAEPNQDAEELMEVDSNCLEDAATDLIEYVPVTFFTLLGS